MGLCYERTSLVSVDNFYREIEGTKKDRLRLYSEDHTPVTRDKIKR